MKFSVFVKDLLSYGPNHPVQEKFNETNFLTDIDKLVNNLRQNRVKGVKSSVRLKIVQNGMLKNRETPVDRRLSKVTKYLEEHDLLVVPFDRGQGFLRKEKAGIPNKTQPCF